MKLRRFLALCLVCLPSCAFGQRVVTFPAPNQPGEIQADLYGSGTRGLILAHGGCCSKENWKKQAEGFAKSGFLVLAIRLRGDGFKADGSPTSVPSSANDAADILASVSYLCQTGAKTIAAVGASFGGDAVGNASSQSPTGTFDRVVFLASLGGDGPEKLGGRKLYIVARDDSNSAGLRLPGISGQYAKAPGPKKLVVLEGSAHAQLLFDTSEGPHLLDEILRFLTEP